MSMTKHLRFSGLTSSPNILTALLAYYVSIVLPLRAEEPYKPTYTPIIPSADVSVQSLRKLISVDYETDIIHDDDLIVKGQDGMVINITVSKERNAIELQAQISLKKSDFNTRMEVANRLNAGVFMGSFAVLEEKNELISTYNLPIGTDLNKAQFESTYVIFGRCVMRAFEKKFDVDGIVGKHDSTNAPQQAHPPSSSPQTEKAENESADSSVHPPAPEGAPTKSAVDDLLQQAIAHDPSLFLGRSGDSRIIQGYEANLITNKLTSALITNAYTRVVNGETFFVYDVDVSIEPTSTNPQLSRTFHTLSFSGTKKSISVGVVRRGVKWYIVDAPK